MRGIDDLQRRYCSRALGAAVILGLLAHLAGWPAVARGLLLGGLFSALNFVLLGKTLARRLGGGPQGGAVGNRLARVGRYLLWGVPTLLAVKLPAVDLPAAVAGMFMVQVSLLLDAVVQHLRGGKSSPT